MSGPLCTRLRQICTTVIPLLGPGRATDGIAAVAARLAEPNLRIAVGGRVNAGKSTLVNALVGQRLAATAVTECTMLVTWFRNSHQNRIEVRRHDGLVYHVPGRLGGGVPHDLSMLGSPREKIAEIVVEVANKRLAEDYTIVDTPGMDSLSGLDEAAMGTLAQADALLYAMPLPGKGDMEALEALRRKVDRHITAVNVLGVLSRIDELGEGTGDPWPAARRLAKTYAGKLRGLVSTVLPVAGLLAEAALSDTFTEHDAGLLARLATSAPADLDEALYSPDEFRAWSMAPIDATSRARILGLLGRYGIRVAVDTIRSGAIDSTELLHSLRRHSGIDALLAHIHEQFVDAADRLRATSALALLEEAAWWGDTFAEREVLSALRAQLANVRRHPLIRQAELTPALVDLVADRLRLGASDADALVELSSGRDAASCLRLPADATAQDVKMAAKRAAAHWRVLESSLSRATQRHVRVARELCEAFYFSADA